MDTDPPLPPSPPSNPTPVALAGWTVYGIFEPATEKYIYINKTTRAAVDMLRPEFHGYRSLTRTWLQQHRYDAMPPQVHIFGQGLSTGDSKLVCAYKCRELIDAGHNLLQSTGKLSQQYQVRQREIAANQNVVQMISPVPITADPELEKRLINEGYLKGAFTPVPPPVPTSYLFNPHAKLKCVQCEWITDRAEVNERTFNVGACAMCGKELKPYMGAVNSNE